MIDLCEYFKVKSVTQFKLDHLTAMVVDNDLVLDWNGERMVLSAEAFEQILNPALIKRPITLTENEQVIALGRIAEGTPWCVVDNIPKFFKEKPFEHNQMWVSVRQTGVSSHSDSGNNGNADTMPSLPENTPVYLPDILEGKA